MKKLQYSFSIQLPPQHVCLSPNARFRKEEKTKPII